jgi:hypothetical protein
MAKSNKFKNITGVFKKQPPCHSPFSGTTTGRE